MTGLSRDKPGDCARFLAFDLGAESSRAILGLLDDDSLELRELHRFPTRHVTVRGTSFWDILFVFAEMKQALRSCVREYGPELDGIGVDSWGVDFGLLTPGGQTLANPVQYRDHRTDGILDEAFEVLPREVLYERTGIQFLPFNTLYQLWAMQRTAPRVLEAAQTFLMIPDLLNYYLTGERRCEYSNASTTQMLDVRRRTWNRSILQAFSLPVGILPDVIMPGSRIGPLGEAILKETGLDPVFVFAPCTHDTGSAMAAAPGAGDRWACISCGTWSVVGAELESPVTSAKALRYNFTNEGGYGGRIRFLKNIMGLWVLQQCRAAWAAEGQEYTYAELAAMAGSSGASSAVLNIDDPGYLNPENMLEAIATQCRATGQPVPEDVGATARAVLEGLALRYNRVLTELEDILGVRMEKIHMVGGGVQNELLCQWASDAMDRPVIAGPVEATAVGNLAVQAVAAGRLSGLEAARRLIGRTCDLKNYTPRERDRWATLIERYSEIYS